MITKLLKFRTKRYAWFLNLGILVFLPQLSRKIDEMQMSKSMISMANMLNAISHRVKSSERRDVHHPFGKNSKWLQKTEISMRHGFE